MALQAIAVGCEVDLREPQAGRVHSVFDRAVNLLVGGELWTVFGPDHPDSPFGLRLAAGGLATLRGLRAGDPVQVRAGRAGLGRQVIDGRAAARWAPKPWPTVAAGLAQRLDAVSEAARARAWPGSEPLANAVMQALVQALMQALPACGAGSGPGLAEAVRRTVGRGPGLTPAGDDVLVGILTLLSSSTAGEAGARATARLAEALAPRLRSTTDLSRHLILQAARGRPGGALQALGQALLGGATGDGLRAALEPVLATGATSGADACVGLVAACRLVFPAAERIAA
ncbi:MAG: DUF2877 domain-containing protein [Burkholderiaceae bacterium]|nr:DUF2877 domain-containing protein [Burkholderiaceae bacterium]